VAGAVGVAVAVAVAVVVLVVVVVGVRRIKPSIDQSSSSEVNSVIKK
jgi:hypothetical protein